MTYRWISLTFTFAVCCMVIDTLAQTNPTALDSIAIPLIGRYDNVGLLHRKIFGENYRKEYALETKIPVIRLSNISGGLKATVRGGGNQTHSLRLEDSQGREWALRSVEKFPEVLLPNGLRETFLKDIIRDNMSSQHPFSALIVPVLAEAINAPHSNPVIGWVASDPGLGNFASEFEHTVCLLEEREPLGKSDNTLKMRRRLLEDNNTLVDANLFLKLKCLDVLIGDWDRHDDQWRWKLEKHGKKQIYIPIPRDRDQVFYRSQGWAQRYSQSSWFLPMMQGYERDIQNINWFLWEGRELAAQIFSQMDEQQWDRIVTEFCTAMNDQVLEAALSRIPEPGYSLRHDELFAQMKKRRSQLPQLMNSYYHFFNRIVDIELTDKNEQIAVSQAGIDGLKVSIRRANKNGKEKEEIFSRSFDAATTREIRVYLQGGKDSISIDVPTSRIKLRLVAGHGEKSYDVIRSGKNILQYGDIHGATYSGAGGHKLIRHRSPDSANLAYVPKDMYHRRILFPNIGLNRDDGLLAGAAFYLKNPGFRKVPYGNLQSLSFLYSFGTTALKLNYSWEWLHAWGKKDFLLQASAYAPSNTQNFFGFGNESTYNRDDRPLSYYRPRFNLFQLNPSFRWRNNTSMLSIGPSLQYYSYDKQENIGRLPNSERGLYGADSLSLEKSKAFAGLLVNYHLNTRDQDLLPSKGILLETKLSAYHGLNKYARSIAQLNLAFSFHQRLDSASRVVITNRIGGGLTLGKPSFFQAQFLGGQGNLLGYRQYRFAGEHAIYNNFELRIKLGDFVNYVLPGQIGIMGLSDIGRVWVAHESSRQWHYGFGGGLYFAPASLSLFRLVAAHSKEGWYPYFSMSFRY